MELYTFIDTHKRRVFIDKDGWYEPCVNELHINEGRTRKQTRAPISSCFTLNATLGTKPDCPNCLLVDQNFNQNPHLLQNISKGDTQVKAVYVDGDNNIELYRAADIQQPIFQSRISSNGRHIILKMGRYPANRTEFRNLLAIKGNKIAKYILTSNVRMPDDHSTSRSSWYEDMLELNAWSVEEKTTIQSLCYNKRVITMPLKSQETPESHWHVHSKPLSIRDPKYRNVLRHLQHCGTRRGYCHDSGLHQKIILLQSVRQQGGTVIGTTADGVHIKWKNDCCQTDFSKYLQSLFKGPQLFAKHFHIPIQKYTANVQNRILHMPLQSEFVENDNSVYCKTFVNGELVATSNIQAESYTSPHKGFVYTTDIGLNMGLPHMVNEERIGDLGNKLKFSGSHYNIFSNSAVVTCAGQSLKNVEGKLELGLGDNGMRLALLSALDCMLKCHERTVVPEILVFEISDPVNAAQICGMMHAFPIKGYQSPSSMTIKYVNGGFFEVRHGEMIKKDYIVGIKPAVFRDSKDCKINIARMQKYMRQVRKKVKSTNWTNEEVFVYRDKTFKNELEPFTVDNDNTLVIAECLRNVPVIPVSINGKTLHLLNNTTSEDPRTALLQNVAFRCTSRIDDFVLIRPFPVKTELYELKDKMLHSCDMMFENSEYTGTSYHSTSSVQ